ncbi:hypothetical protein BXY39_2617 [Eilatimonas milleporae]|uniref:Uncharacterized protein n=1 Tax=Eilatimonas milleporae TaxID=911205 RepID=A0A3M0C5N1_9PROT|nr:hypothetical protein BXY39_2617 [Eilatimonas milleporae]
MQYQTTKTDSVLSSKLAAIRLSLKGENYSVVSCHPTTKGFILSI